MINSRDGQAEKHVDLRRATQYTWWEVSGLPNYFEVSTVFFECSSHDLTKLLQLYSDQSPQKPLATWNTTSLELRVKEAVNSDWPLLYNICMSASIIHHEFADGQVDGQ